MPTAGPWMASAFSIRGDGVDLRVDAGLDALDHAGVEVAKVFLFERGGTAAVSGDLDVSAATDVRM